MTVYNNIPPRLTPSLLPPVLLQRFWGLWATIGYSLVIIVVFVVAQGIVIVIPALSSALSHAAAAASQQELIQMVLDDINANLGLWQSIATIFSGIAGTGMVILFIKARRGAGIAEYLGLKKPGVKMLLAAIGITVAAIALADSIQFLFGVQGSEPIMDKIYSTAISPPLFWIAVVIFAPLFEEALFRGFMFEGIRLSSLGAYGAVMLTAFAWSILHGFQYGIGGIVYIFFLGIVMGIVRWKTKNIWSTFTMHAVINLIATIALASGGNF